MTLYIGSRYWWTMPGRQTVIPGYAVELVVAGIITECVTRTSRTAPGAGHGFLKVLKRRGVVVRTVVDHHPMRRLAFRAPFSEGVEL